MFILGKNIGIFIEVACKVLYALHFSKINENL